MKRLFIFIFLYIFVYSAKSQEYIHPTSSLFELEYEVVEQCSRPYKAEIYAFQVTGLLKNRHYTFTIDSLLTNFDDISFYPVTVF